jgi:hypothetical protein
MKHFKFIALILGLLLFGCYQSNKKSTSMTEENISSSTDDKKQIQTIIRYVLGWADSKNSIDLLPVITDSSDRVYVGFDLNKHKQNLDKLRQTDFFANEFIDNYDRIILTLDKGLRNGKYHWLVGELPTFLFANNINPWIMCQDVPYDKPSPWDFIEIDIIQLANDKGLLNWKWGKGELNSNQRWKDFSYKFRVIKENGRWKIAYLQGFDFEESTRIDGQL